MIIIKANRMAVSAKCALIELSTQDSILTWELAYLAQRPTSSKERHQQWLDCGDEFMYGDHIVGVHMGGRDHILKSGHNRKTTVLCAPSTSRDLPLGSVS